MIYWNIIDLCVFYKMKNMGKAMIILKEVFKGEICKCWIQGWVAG